MRGVQARWSLQRSATMAPGRVGNQLHHRHATGLTKELQSFNYLLPGHTDIVNNDCFVWALVTLALPGQQHRWVPVTAPQQMCLQLSCQKVRGEINLFVPNIFLFSNSILIL